MGSAGGNLYEGLQMGAILRDKGIATYVPQNVSCESSCANMFFGGAKRKAKGKLGVHQFYSPDGSRSAPVGEAEAKTTRASSCGGIFLSSASIIFNSSKFESIYS